MTPDAFAAELRACLTLLNQGQAALARPRIEALLADQPDQPDALAVLGLALDQLGDAAAGAERLRRAIALKPDQPQYHFELGRLLDRAGRSLEAAEAYRANLQLVPRHGAARHNLGVALFNAGDDLAAEAELRQALAGGYDTPETQLMLGRVLEQQGQHEGAEAAFRAAIARRPHDLAAHRDLSQLIWRRTQDGPAAIAALDVAIAQGNAPSELFVHKAGVFEFAGNPAGALACLSQALASRPGDVLLLAATAQAGLRLQPDRALEHARQAAALSPDNAPVRATLCQAQLAAGDAAGALETAETACRFAPTDQQALALRDTARRLLDEGAAFEADLVRTYILPTPAGWTSLASYLADLEAALAKRHGLGGHPLGQSTRHGGEATLDPRNDADPVIRAFFEVVRRPIAQHIAAIGSGQGPFRSRSSGDFRFAGAWSVRLRPEGFHANHIHPRGWISSAFYVALPSVMAAGEGEDRAGWLKFGEPGPPTRPALDPQHFVRPEPGLLALFPSYLWHGTIPFGGDEPRLTIAFDVVPA